MIFLKRWFGYNKITQGDMHEYKKEAGAGIFVIAGLGTLLIALFAVGLHTVKAAWSNPLDSIRYE